MRKLLLSLLIVFFFFNSSPLVLAAENKPVTITATVPDEIEPTVPILVAPENGAFLSKAAPTFVFKRSHDSQSPLRHYVMYLNGQLFIPEIPATQTPVATNQYSATILDKTVSFTLKQPLTDATYTWMIRAYDTYNNWSGSATWTFTIDTQAPFIIITQVDQNTNLNLSSKDPASIPLNLIIKTTSLTPEFKGRSEPGALIQISLTATNGQNISFTTTTNNKGRFKLAPPNKLQIGEKYQVLVIGADAAANTTALKEFFVLIQAMPTVPLLVLPPPVLQKPQALIQLPQAKPVLLANIWLVLVLLCFLLWLALSKLAYGLPYSLLPSYLVLFLVPPFFKKQKKCLVYHFKNNQGVSFATVLVKALPSQNLNFYINKLTNIKGRFNLSLKPGQYELKILSSGFLTSRLQLSLKQKTSLQLKLALMPRTQTYFYYQLTAKLAQLCLLLTFVFSLFSLAFYPNLLTLGLFLLSLDLILNLWL